MKADLLIKSKSIFTAKEDAPQAGAVAVVGNKIAAILSEKEAETWEAVRVIDAGDKLVMPGFVDAHDHYFMGALSASSHMCTDLFESTSEAECVEMMKKYAAEHPNEKRLLGIGWFPATWNDAPLPSKKTLDEAFPDKPVYLMAADIHTFWLNTKALEEACITPDMKPRSGSVGVDENGELNGLLHEPDACASSMDKIQEFDKETIKEINDSFLKHIAANGVTSISEMTADDYSDGNLNKYLAIKEMEEEGKLICRLHVYTHLDGYRDFTTAKEWQAKLNSEKFRINGVKAFVDGVTSTFTGLLLEPYSDRPDTKGIDVPNVPENELREFVIAANGQGLPVRLHCIGDGAVRMALDIYEESEKVNGKHGLANTIEHIESIHPDDIPRFKKLNVIPSMQPLHLTLDMNEKIVRIGRERCRWEWPHRTILDEGGVLAFGTDYPVVEFNPFPSIYAAVTRLDEEGVPTGINPEEKITLAEALRAYTLGAAHAYGRDDIGALEVGRFADITIVNKNLFAIKPEEIKDCGIEMTICDGQITYEA